MTDERTWVQRKRSEAECLEVLKDLDERTLVRRAQRLAMLVQIQVDWNNHLPHRSSRMLSEASACFTEGQYTGCILALATGAEHGLRELLDIPGKPGLDRLIKLTVCAGAVNNSQAKVLRSLKLYRNRVTHSRIDELAYGKTLQRQMGVMTITGLVASSEWETFTPETRDDKETAVDLSAEREVGQILVATRIVMHDIFDGRAGPKEVNTEISQS